MKNKKQYKELLDDIVCDQCDHPYCFLKELLVSIHPSERLLMQMKCIEKFKFEESKRQQREVSWAEAAELWVTQKHAKAFAESYEENKKYTQIYKEVMKR